MGFLDQRYLLDGQGRYPNHRLWSRRRTLGAHCPRPGARRRSSPMRHFLRNAPAFPGGKMSKLAVVAIGGNSLIKDEAHKSVPDQFAAVRETAVHIAEMIAQGWNVVITHGNGPQVGFILLRSELAQHVLHHTLPLDVAGADSQGGIGYMIQQALGNEFRRRGLSKQAGTLVTQVLVDPTDPAMQHPSKPIGLFYDANEAEQKRREEGWSMVEDA